MGVVVGRKLWNLTNAAQQNGSVHLSHQVLCITHLPQIAAYGDAHYRVDKVIANERTSTAVRGLQGEERVSELAQMLGAVGEAGTLSAAEILQAAEREKQA